MGKATAESPSREFKHSSVSIELYQALFEESTDAMFIIDEQGRAVAANQRASELTGHAQTSLIGMKLTDLIADDEAVIRRNDGNLVPIAISTPALSDGHMLVVVRDLSSHKQLEALRAAEETYRSLVESAEDPMFTSDAQTGRYLYVNPIAARLLGRTQAEVIGKTPEELFPPQVARVYRAGVSQVVETGETLTAHDMSEINGRRVWFSSVVQPVRDRQGKIKAVQAVARDITSLKQAEEALRESEERLRQAVRVSHIGIFDHDHLTGSLYYSPEMRDICGWGLDEPVTFGIQEKNSQGTWDLSHPEDREQVRAALREAHRAEGNGLFDLEYRIIRRDGSVLWLTS